MNKKMIALFLLSLISHAQPKPRVLVSHDELMATFWGQGIDLEGEWYKHIGSLFSQPSDFYGNNPATLSQETSKLLNNIIDRAMNAHLSSKGLVTIDPNVNIAGNSPSKILGFTKQTNQSPEDNQKKQQNRTLACKHGITDQAKKIPLYDGKVSGEVVLGCIYEYIRLFFAQDQGLLFKQYFIPMRHVKEMPHLYILYDNDAHNMYLDCCGYEDLIQKEKFHDLSWYKIGKAPELSSLEKPYQPSKLCQIARALGSTLRSLAWPVFQSAALTIVIMELIRITQLLEGTSSMPAENNGHQIEIIQSQLKHLQELISANNNITSTIQEATASLVEQLGNLRGHDALEAVTTNLEQLRENLSPIIMHLSNLALPSSHNQNEEGSTAQSMFSMSADQVNYWLGIK